MYTSINLRHDLFSRNIHLGKKYTSPQAQCCNWPLTPYSFTSAMVLSNPNNPSLILYSSTGAFNDFSICKTPLIAYLSCVKSRNIFAKKF